MFLCIFIFNFCQVPWTFFWYSFQRYYGHPNKKGHFFELFFSESRACNVILRWMSWRFKSKTGTLEDKKKDVNLFTGGREDGQRYE